MVPMEPTMYPACEKALGMARMPVPRLPFSRCSSVSALLKKNSDNFGIFEQKHLIEILKSIMGCVQVIKSNSLSYRLLLGRVQ